MSPGQPRRPKGTGGGRFTERSLPEPDIVLVEYSDGDDDERKARRLPQTVAEIEECIADAAGIVSRGHCAFLRDKISQRAAKNILSEIGEGVSRLPTKFKAERNDVPWEKIRGMRNVVTHAYQDVETEVVWSTLETDLPALAATLRPL